MDLGSSVIICSDELGLILVGFILGHLDPNQKKKLLLQLAQTNKTLAHTLQYSATDKQVLGM